MTKYWTGLLVFFCLSLLSTHNALAEAQQFYKPYILARTASQPLDETLTWVRDALTAGGFDIAGEYRPSEGAHILAVTSSTLKSLAAKTGYGGFGAAQRVSVTVVGDQVQVAYTNPDYMGLVYRMKADMAPVRDGLAAALGNQTQAGSKHGQTEYNLQHYHYMMFMPYFDDRLKLADHGSYSEAIRAVEQGLAQGAGGTRKIYRIDIPGKEQSLFGVALSQGEGADTVVMQATDIEPFRHTAHLPYELLVNGGEVVALHGKFRIAQSFPDLSMGTFMQISGAPDGIEEALMAAAGRQ